MSRFRNRLVKRVMAVILSGAMIMSNMTALASETSVDSGGGYVEEIIDDTEKEDAVEEAAEADAVTETTVAEDTAKDEDNNADKKDDSEDAEDAATETTVADKADDDDADAEEEDKTSETKSSLDAETEEVESTEDDESEVTEEEDRDEDVKAEFAAMDFNSNSSYIFNAADIADSIAADTEVITDDGAFALIGGSNTTVDATAKSKFYYWDATSKNIVADATTTKAVNMGDDAAKTCAIKFQVSQAVDVTVYWVANAVDSQMSILDSDGKTVIKTHEVTNTAKPNKLHISTMTLKDSGTYYLGGNNKVYKVRVEPQVSKRTSWDWEIKDSTNSAYLSGDCAGVEDDAALEYFDLRIDANAGKFDPREGDVQTTREAIVHIPVSGRSRITIKAYQANYKVEGIAATSTEDSFTCVGEGGYVPLEIGTYLNKITVVPIETVGVSGKVTLTDGTLKAGTQVIFTEDTTKEVKTVITADIDSSGNYSANLYKGVTYIVSLSEKEYSISGDSTIEITESESENRELNITASETTLEDVEGNIIFPSGATVPSDLKLQFTEKNGTHIVRDMTLNGAKYTVALKPDTDYVVEVVSGTRINDYVLKTESINSTQKDITFDKQPVKKVNVTVKTNGIGDIDLSETKITFTNKNEEGYTYPVTGTDNIQLRDGTYSITEMDLQYPYWFDFSKTFEVKETDQTVNITLDFSERMSWDFSNKNDLMLTAVAINGEANADHNYNGLIINRGSGNIRLDINGGQIQVASGIVIKIPVSGKGTIQVVTAGTAYTHYTIGAATATEVDAEYPYDVTGEEGEQSYVTLTSTNSQLYIKKIVVTREAESSGDKESGEATESSSSPESSETEPSIERPETFPTEWDFTKGSPLYASDKVVGYQGTSGYLEGLYIDASSGKFNTKDRVNDGWAQVNAPVTIKVPVKGASTVTLTWYGSEKYTIDDSPLITGTGSYISKGTNGWATVKVTEGPYLGKISVKELDKVKVSGNVTLPSDAPSDMKVIFTEKTERASKFTVEADIVNGKYETELYCTGEKYAISFSVDGYNITTPEGAVIDAVKNENGIDQDITAVSIDITDIVGNVIFPTDVDDADIPSDLKLTFTEKVESGTPHVVEDVEVTDGEYTVKLKPDTIYTVTAKGTGLNDFDIKTPAEINTAEENGNTTVEFVAKTTYPVTLAITSFDEDAIDKSKIQLVFTNVNEEGYKYERKGTDTIALRNGTYSVSASAGYPYMPVKIAEFKIESASKECALDFAERLEWSFYAGSDLMEADKQMTVEGKGETTIVELEGLQIDVTNGKFHTKGRNSDAQVNKGTIIKIPLRTKSEVTIEGYDSGSNYKVDGKQNTKQTDTFVCEGTEGYATFEMLPATAGTNGEYLKKITVKPVKEVIIPDNRKIDVWDFAGKLETDTEKYNNNITPAMWVESGLLQTTSDGDIGRFKGDSHTAYTHTFGDLLMTYHGQDRIYSTQTEMKNISAGSSYVTTYDDGYETVGAWYCNGCGTETTRNVTIENVASGDIIVVYAGKHKADVTYYFEGVGVENTQKEAGPILNGGVPQYQKLTFIAENTGTYKIYPIGSGSDPKNLYHRIVRIPGVKVSGSIDFKTFNLENYTVKFINQTTKQEFPVTVKEDNSFELSLAPGYTYLAVLNGAPGYGFADDGKTITIPADSGAVNNVTLTVETKDMYQYTGQIKGLEAGTNIDRLVMTMIPPKDSNSDEVPLNINKETLSFDAYLESNLEYTIQLEGVDDYVVKTPLSVKSSADLAQDIVLERKPRYTANGAFIGLNDAKVTALSFTLLNDAGAEDNNYVYPAEIANGGYGYSVLLRDGSYIAKATVDKAGYTTQSHVVVNGADVYKDLMFISAEDTTALTRVANLYVGYPGKKNNYSTVNAAVKAAKRMNPTKEDERITIHIAPGTYTEQILIEAPYITFTNDEPSQEVKLTWYYGIGYKYYSAKGGYYDEASAFDKYEKYEVQTWGTTVRLNAPGFRAENITFENSFNQRIVDAELEDGVESAGTKPERKKGVDVDASNYKERACVMYINDKADKAEFYKCQFISNQDTLGTGKKGTHAYFKDCLFEGTTDYICGDGDCVFDSCELRWAGQSDQAAGGVITAAQDAATHGYLFWNCRVTANKNRKVSAGHFGRPWGAGAKVIFVNTQLERADLISDKGWDNMGDNQAANANFKEFGTTFNGAPVDTSKRLADTVQTENPVPDMTVYFDGWTPLYYNYDETKVVREPVSSEKRNDVEAGTEITLSCATTDAKIYYTINGDDPTGKDSELYTAGTKISLGNEEQTVIVKAIAKVGDVSSNMAVFEYNVKSAANLIAQPTATVEPGVVEAGTAVLLNCATDGASIYFTIDGSEPKVDSNLLYRNQPILIYDTKTIKAIAVKDTNVSDPVEFKYLVRTTLTAEPGDGAVFTSAGGAVTLTAASGATIYYTVSSTEADLTDPADESNTARIEYTAPIQIKAETYIWAVAIKDGLASDPLKCHYTVLEEGGVVPPTANPGTSEVKSGTIVTLTVTDDTIEHIYYTTDGSDPKVEGDARKTYDPLTGIVITEAVTIKAVAQKGDKYSAVIIATYTIAKEDNPDNPDNPSTGPDKEKDPVVITLDECEVVVPSIIRKKETDPIKPETYVTYKGYRFVEGLDYSVSEVSEPDSEGYYAVTLTGLERDNNGRMEETYKIAASPTRVEKFKVVSTPAKGDTSVVDFSKAKVSLDASAKTAVYTGSVIEPKLDADPKKDKDGLVTKLGDRINYAYKNNINVGKATVTISVKPPKATDEDQTIYAGSKTFTFNIKKATLNKNQDKATAKVIYEEPDDLNYKGNGVGIELKSCKVTVGTAPNTVDLKAGRDYTVTYKNNAKAGKATVTVKGIGNNVSGSWSTTYTIAPLNLAELTINAADQTMYYSPKGAKLGTITAKKDNVTYTLKEGTDFTAKYIYDDKKTKAAGTDVAVTISGKNGCTGKNITIEDKIKIVPADFDKCISVSSDVVLDKTTKAGKEKAALAKALAVTDTSGAKLKLDKDYTIDLKTDDKTNAPIVVIAPVDKTNSNYTDKEMKVPYRVAANLAKEKTFMLDKNLEKTDPLSYDGRNPVQITQRDIDKYINTPNNTNYQLGTNIRIVPGTYKNNTKKGSAQVTVEGIGEFYGTKVLKFKIVEK